MAGVSMSNAKYKHERKPNYSEHSRIGDTSHLCNIDISTVISTFNSSLFRHIPEFPIRIVISMSELLKLIASYSFIHELYIFQALNSTENAHFLCHLNTPERPFPYDATVNDIEFMGYFFLAGQLYRVV